MKEPLKIKNFKNIYETKLSNGYFKITLLSLYILTFLVVSWTLYTKSLVLAGIFFAVNFTIYCCILLSRKLFERHWIWIFSISLLVGFISLFLPLWNSVDVNFCIAAVINHNLNHVNFFTTSYGAALKSGVHLTIVPKGIYMDGTYPYGYFYFELIELFYSIGKSFNNIFMLLRITNLILLQLTIFLLAILLKELKSRITYTNLLLLIGLNPFILQNAIVDCHQEFIALPFIVGGIILLNRKRYFMSMFLLLCALQVKMSFVFYIPFILIYILQQLKGFKAKMVFIGVTAAMFGLLTSPYYLFYGTTPWKQGFTAATQAVGNSPVMLLLSFIMFFYQFILHAPAVFQNNSEKILFVLTKISSLSVGGTMLFLFWRSLKQKMTMRNVFFYILTAYVCYSFIFATTLLSWHLLWMLPLWLIVVRDDKALVNVVIAGGIIAYAIQFSRLNELTGYPIAGYTSLVFFVGIMYVIYNEKIKTKVKQIWHQEILREENK